MRKMPQPESPEFLHCEGENMKPKGQLILSSIAIAASVLLLCGCSTKPDKKVVRETIVRYFQDRHYEVLKIDIGAISSIPVRSRVYMGPEGYTVRVRSITIEAMEDSGPPLNYKKGQVLAFGHALIRIIAGEKGGWLVSNISGITVL